MFVVLEIEAQAPLQRAAAGRRRQMALRFAPHSEMLPCPIG